MEPIRGLSIGHYLIRRLQDYHIDDIFGIPGDYVLSFYILDNGGYGTERFLHPGQWEYNDIHGWNYSRLTEVFGGGKGYEVRTEGDLAAAVDAAFTDKAELSLIHVHISRDDRSPTLARMAERLSKRV